MASKTVLDDPGWYKVVGGLSALLEEKATVKQWSTTLNDLQQGMAVNPHVVTRQRAALFETAGEYIQSFITCIKRRMDIQAEKEDVFEIYRQCWHSFLQTIKFVSRPSNDKCLHAFRKMFFRVALNCWADVMLLSHDNQLFDGILAVISRSIEDGSSVSEVKRLPQIKKILLTFQTLQFTTRKKSFENLEKRFIELIVKKVLPAAALKTVNATPSTETIRQITKLKKDIKKYSVALHLSQKVKWHIDQVTATEISSAVCLKMSEELYFEFMTSAKAIVGAVVDVAAMVEKNRYQLFARNHCALKKLQPLLVKWKQKVDTLKALCGLYSRMFDAVWQKRALTYISCFKMERPVTADYRRLDKSAYLDKFFDSWWLFCQYVYFLDTVIHYSIPGNQQINFVDECLSEFYFEVFSEQRAFLYNFLTDYFCDFFLEHNYLENEIVYGIVNSLRILPGRELVYFEDTFKGKVILRIHPEISKKLFNECAHAACTTMMKDLINKVDRCRKRLHLSNDISYHYKELQFQAYGDFVCKSIGSLIRDADFKSFKPLCNMLDHVRTDVLRRLIETVSNHCESKGREMLQNLNGSQRKRSFIENFYRAADFFKLIVENMENNRIKDAALTGFQSALESFQEQMNAEPSTALAQYCNKLLSLERADHKDQTRILLEILIIARRLSLFKELPNFSKHYYLLLSKRLLSGCSISNELESHCLRCFESLLEPTYEARMSEMMRDDDDSAILTSEFLLSAEHEMLEQTLHGAGGDTVGNYAAESIFQQIDIKMRVLRSRIWPLKIWRTTFTPSWAFRKVMRRFETFYKTRHESRNLTWAYCLPTVVMNFNYTSDGKTYEVNCNMFVATVMLMFEETNQIDLRKMQMSLNVQENLLRQLLKQLIDLKILAVNQSDSAVELNIKFVSQSQKLKIKMEHIKEKNENTIRSSSEAKGDTGFSCLQAHMVRIMKRIKHLSKKRLVELAIGAVVTKLCPDPAVITAALENLVERGYLLYDATTDHFQYIP